MSAVSPAADAFGPAAESQAPAAPRKLPGLLAIWAALACFALFINLPGILNFRAVESDDWLRLLQVRDWVNGQGWFDSRQYRMNPPAGADIHWVRLVDLPLGAALWFFKLFLGQRAAETATMIVVPLLQLGVFLLLLREMMRTLGADRVTTLVALVILPLYPILTPAFVPMRIDHHAWQGILAFASVILLLRGGARRAALAGALSAALLWISVEGLAIVAVIGSIYALRWWQEGERDLDGYLLGLAVAGPALLVLLRPPAEYALAWCDMMSWPHMLAFAAAAVAFGATRALPGMDRPLARLAVLSPLPVIALTAVLVPLGKCGLMPMSVLDPLLQDNWQANLVESAPIWRQIPSSAAINLMTIVLIGAGWVLSRRLVTDPQKRAQWTTLCLAGLGAGAISLLVMRGGLTSEMLALPFSALLIVHFLPQARAIARMSLRVPATIAVFLLATPTAASIIAKPFDARVSYTLVSHPKLATEGICKLDRLQALPDAHMFASLDLSAQILGRTEHSVVMGGYHRNQSQMLDVFAAFGGPLGDARDIIKRNGAEYVATCTGSADLAAYANMGEDNLADRIFYRRKVDWLETVEGFETGPLRLYRVK